MLWILAEKIAVSVTSKFLLGIEMPDLFGKYQKLPESKHEDAPDVDSGLNLDQFKVRNKLKPKNPAIISVSNESKSSSHVN